MTTTSRKSQSKTDTLCATLMNYVHMFPTRSADFLPCRLDACTIFHSYSGRQDCNFVRGTLYIKREVLMAKYE